MRNAAAALAVVASALVPTLASAAAPPANILFAGTITRSFLPTGRPNWCLFEGSNSTFIRRGTLALISFPDFTVVPTGSVGPAYVLGGQASLTFKSGSTTEGTVDFQQVPGNNGINRHPGFTHYHASYDTTTHVLTVNFRVHFGVCTLIVNGTYRN
jgi:hypothetical protein